MQTPTRRASAASVCDPALWRVPDDLALYAGPCSSESRHDDCGGPRNLGVKALARNVWRSVPHAALRMSMRSAACS